MSGLRFVLKLVVVACLVLVAAIPAARGRKRSRWLLASVVFVVGGILLVGCDLSSKPYPPNPAGVSAHWNRVGSAPVLVTYTIDPSAAVLVPWIRQNAGEWSAGSKLVEIREAPCQPGGNCVRIFGEPRNGGGAGYCTTCGHIPTAVIRFDDSPGQHPANVDLGLCHEWGHVLGLDHGTGPGPCRAGKPTAWDLAVVDVLHDHRH